MRLQRWLSQHVECTHSNKLVLELYNCLTVFLTNQLCVCLCYVMVVNMYIEYMYIGNKPKLRHSKLN